MDNIIDIARWLAENHNELLGYINKFPITELEKLDALNKIVREQYNMSYEDVSVMFEDEKLRLIIDRYYLKQLH